MVTCGFSVQYSTYYLTDRFTGGPPAEEPLFQFVPLVEFAFSNTLGPDSTQRTQASANPGLAYVGATWQVAAEAIVPLNRALASCTGQSDLTTSNMTGQQTGHLRDRTHREAVVSGCVAA